MSAEDAEQSFGTAVTEGISGSDWPQMDAGEHR